jgi:hypothetical protein
MLLASGRVLGGTVARGSCVLLRQSRHVSRRPERNSCPHPHKADLIVNLRRERATDEAAIVCDVGRRFVLRLTHDVAA